VGVLIEDQQLRNRFRVFADLGEGGRVLAELMARDLEGVDGLVLAIPAGGVPVGVQVAQRLHLSLDLVICRKIQIPWEPEAGFGAVDPDGEYVVDERFVDWLGIGKAEVRRLAQQVLKRIRQREQRFRGNRPYPDLRDRTVILVDDGLATGYTMLAAVRFVRRRGAARIIVGAPTASLSAIHLLLPETDALYCPNIRTHPVYAVADAYQTWYDLTDSEVLRYLQEAGLMPQ